MTKCMICGKDKNVVLEFRNILYHGKPFVICYDCYELGCRVHNVPNILKQKEKADEE